MGQLGSVQVLGQLCSVVRNKLIAIWIGPVGVGLVILFNSVSATSLNTLSKDVPDANAAAVSCMYVQNSSSSIL